VVGCAPAYITPPRPSPSCVNSLDKRRRLA